MDMKFWIVVLAITGVALFVWRIGTRRIKLKERKILHLMIDLETLSLSSNAYIRSIGACFFDEHGPQDKFYISCDGPPQEFSDVDEDTLLWWAKQDEAARNALENPGNIDLEYALKELNMFIKEVRDDYSSTSVQSGGTGYVDVWVWANGSDFDTVILRNAFERLRMQMGWHWFNVRCYRTLKNIHREIKAPDFEGQKHNALSDAVHQARHASIIMNSARLF